MASYERFVVFAFRKGQATGGAGDFVATASLDTGEGFLEGLARLLRREGVVAGEVDTVHLVEAASIAALSPLVCIEVEVRPSAGPLIEAASLSVAAR